MDRVPVASSNIAMIGYDAREQVLEVEFKNGRVYQYFGVPESVHVDLMGAGSQGKFFNANIKNAYPSSRTE